METSAHGVTVPSAIYEVDGRRFETASRGFADAIAKAHASHQRPRCLCLVEGVEMYVARLAGTNEGFIVKRMPNTGSHHAPDCPSYEPPAEFSGLGQVLGSAIMENPATGETTLKLDFPLSKTPGRSTMPVAGSASDSVATDGTKLSLRGLLHYLWDQAELTRWKPGFSGKRSWTTVRKHLLHAAENKIARGHSLQSRLYIPEVFSVAQRDAINARRIAQWAQAMASPGKPQHLMLLIAEIKEIVPARYGYKAVIKHVPDQAFALDERLYRRLGRRFEAELSLWAATSHLHMVVIATFGVGDAGVPAIAEISLMPVTCQWLPVENSFEVQLVDRLVQNGRSFVKQLRYNMPPGLPIASAVLTDAGNIVVSLSISGPALAKMQPDMKGAHEAASIEAPAWTWRPCEGVMPPFPSFSARVSPLEQDRST